MKRWRLFGMFVFGFFAFMEMGDLLGLLSGFRNPAAFAVITGLSTQEEYLRLVILAILAVAIVISALITVYGLIKRTHWVHKSAAVTAGLFFCYGIYLIFSALIQLNKNHVEVLTTGGIYLLLGTVASWLGGKVRN